GGAGEAAQDEELGEELLAHGQALGGERVGGHGGLTHVGKNHLWNAGREEVRNRRTTILPFLPSSLPAFLMKMNSHCPIRCNSFAARSSRCRRAATSPTQAQRSEIPAASSRNLASSLRLLPPPAASFSRASSCRARSSPSTRSGTAASECRVSPGRASGWAFSTPLTRAVSGAICSARSQTYRSTHRSEPSATVRPHRRAEAAINFCTFTARRSEKAMPRSRTRKHRSA